MEVIAHRGASAYVPEHTFAAYDLALELGAEVLELDVRATADGTLVVLHDPTLARTHGDLRAIADVRLSALGDHAPLTLEAVLARYGDAARYLVELKVRVGREAAALVRAAGLRDHVVVQAFDRGALRGLGGLPVAPLCDDLDAAWDVLRSPGGACALGVRHTAIVPMLVRAAHGRGLAVRGWTANAYADIERLRALGVDGVITDAPDAARPALSAA